MLGVFYFQHFWDDDSINEWGNIHFGNNIVDKVETIIKYRTLHNLFITDSE